MVEAYCVSCRNKVELIDPKTKTNKKGVDMCQGKCPKCGNTANRFMKKAGTAVAPSGSSAPAQV